MGLFDNVSDHLNQRIGHWQHGIGKFKYQSPKSHELSRKRHEKNKHDIWCNCYECQINRLK